MEHYVVDLIGVVHTVGVGRALAGRMGRYRSRGPAKSGGLIWDLTGWSIGRELRKVFIMSLLATLYHNEAGGCRRRSKRSPLQMQLSALGQDENGKVFNCQAMLVNVSRDGGCLTCDHDVRESDNLRLQASDDVVFLVEVRWCQYNVVDNLRYVGFQILKPKIAWLELLFRHGAHQP